MSIELLTLLMFGSMILVLMLGLPFAFATGGVAAIFIAFLFGVDGFMLIAIRVWNTINSYVLIAVPMFVFMGLMLNRSGIAADLYEAIYQWVGRVRGGLAIATVVASSILAAMVGVMGASVVAMGCIALPAMLQRRYNKNIALGCVMAGGALGQLIPPSITFILYGLVAGVSVGGLFLGGIGPGLLLAAFYILYIWIRSSLRPDMAPELSKEEALPLRYKLKLMKHLVAPIFLIIAVLGTIFTGIATPSEAAAFGALGAALSAAIRRQLTWIVLKDVIYETTKITCMIIWLIFGASSFVGVYILAGGADFVEKIILGLGLGPWGILIVMQLTFIIMGMFIDWIGILMLTMPIFVPLIKELGFDPLWFGILFAINTQIGFLSPPFGLAVFYLKSVSPPDITMSDLYRSVWPFLIIQIIVLALVMIFPQIGTWLPNLLIK
jgi:tripartite ATP-independent transporter DctM subunit